MNLFMVILSMAATIFGMFWAWYKLKDAEKGEHDLIGVFLKLISNAGF